MHTGKLILNYILLSTGILLLIPRSDELKSIFIMFSFMNFRFQRFIIIIIIIIILIYTFISVVTNENLVNTFLEISFHRFPNFTKKTSSTVGIYKNVPHSESFYSKQIQVSLFTCFILPLFLVPSFHSAVRRNSWLTVCCQYSILSPNIKGQDTCLSYGACSLCMRVLEFSQRFSWRFRYSVARRCVTG